MVFKNTHYEVLTFPILKIEQLHSKPIKLHNVNALLTTSSNAIQILSELSKNRIIPIYTVGSTSKKLAKRLGFKNVIDCQGNDGYVACLRMLSITGGSYVTLGITLGSYAMSNITLGSYEK